MMEKNRKPKRITPVRWIIIPAVLFIGSACLLDDVASRPTGTPQVILITATGQSGGAETPDQETPTEEPTAAFTPTGTLTPTITLTATPIAPTMTAGQELSCVKGPHWIFYEWVTKIPEGETVTLLAKASEDWEEYYYVRKSDGTECWAFGGSSTKTGDYWDLPVREAPPLPEVEFTITNQTGLDIFDVFIREGDATAWGADRLDGGTIPAGGSFSLTLTAGFYDVKINDPYPAPLYEKHDRPIGAEATYRFLVLNEKMEFYIQNNFAFGLCKFNFRQTGSGSWETLHSPADGTINPGEKAIFQLLPAFYDVEIYDCMICPVHTGAGVYFGPGIPGYVVP